MKGEFTNLGDQNPQEDIIVTINSQPAAAPTGTPGDIPPKVEPSVPPRQEAESLWHDPTAHELRGKEEQSDATESELWSSIESNPNYEVTEIIPKQSMKLSTQSLTNKIAQKPQEGVVQTLAGVIEVDNQTYAVVNVIDGFGGQGARKPHALLTKYTQDPDMRPEIVGIAVPDKPLEAIGEEAASPLKLEIDEHFGIKITNTSEDAIRMVSPTARTKAELMAEFGRQRLEEDFGIKPDENIVAVGSKAVSLAHENPFDDTGLWAAKSADVRAALDEKSNAKTVEIKAVDVKQKTPETNLRSDEMSKVTLETNYATEIADRFSRQVAGIVRAEVQTEEERSFVGSLVENGSRLIQSGIDTGRLELPDDFESSVYFLKLANSVETSEGKARSRLTGETIEDKTIILNAAGRLATGNAKTGFNERRLDTRAEDYALAVMKYYAQMVAKTGGLHLSKYEADALAYLHAKSDQAVEARKKLAAA